VRNQNLSKLDLVKHRAAAILGPEAARAIESLQAAMNEIEFALSMLPKAIRDIETVGFGNEEHVLGKDDQEYVRAQQSAYENILYRNYSGEDRIDLQVQKSVDTVEEICSSILRSQSLWSRWKRRIAPPYIDLQ